MFKVKDKVEFTTLKYKESVCNDNWKEVKLNTEYKIGFVGYYDFGYGEETAVSLLDIGYTGFIPAAILKLSKAKTTLNKDTVKVGQKVRVCNIKGNAIDDWNNAHLPNNYTGTVSSVNGEICNQSPDHFWVYLDNNTSAIGTMHLELLEEPKSEALNPETMVSGEWYKVVSKLDNEYLFKFDKLQFSQIIAFEAYLINKSEKVSQNSLMDTSYIRTLQKASKEEVEKYYPNEFRNVPQEEPEVLVFGKFKIGSIVVSLTDYASRKIGDIFKIVPETNNNIKSGKTLLVYTNSKIEPISSDKKDDFRAATDEEVKAFEQGITNINDIKTEDSYVGRYAKVISNHELTGDYACNSLFYTIGKIGKLTNYKEKRKNSFWVKMEGCSSGITFNQLELMPIGFTPDEVKTEPINTFDKPNFSSYIKGKWYTSASWMPGSYCKFDRIANDLFYFTEKFCDNYMSVSGCWSLYSNIVEADMSEVSKFLPSWHDDKLPEPQNTNTMELPKDWCIKCTSENRGVLKKHPQLEKEYSFIPDNYYGFRGNFTSFNTEYSWGKELTLDEFKRLVLKEDSNLFKEGDYVEIHTDSQGGHTVGTIGVIKEVFKNSCDVYVANTTRICSTYSHAPNYLKLSTKAAYEAQGNTPEEIVKAQGYKVTETYLDAPKGYSPQPPKEGAPMDVILEYCKRVYKLGMEVIPVNSGGQAYSSATKICYEPRIYENHTNYIEGGVGFLYANGKYAQIVALHHEDVKEQIPNFTSINEGELPIVKKNKKSSIIELELVQEKQTINLPIVKKQTIKN